MKKQPKIFRQRWFKNNWFLLIILTLSIFVRFWKLGELFHWTLDEEYWSYVPFNIATRYHFPLIGGPIGGTGVYLGPLFVWVMGAVFFVLRSQPLLIAAFTSTIGVATTLGIYFLSRVGVKITVAQLASLLYATSTLVVLYDRKYWNVSLIPLLVLLTAYLLHWYKSKQNYWWLIGISLSFTIALAFNAHMTGLVSVIVTGVYLFIEKFEWKKIILVGLLFILWQTPILFFDIRHNFINTKAVVSLFTDRKSDKSEKSLAFISAPSLILNTYARVIYTPATDISNELTLCKELADARSKPSILLSFLSLVVLCLVLYKLGRKNIFSLIVCTNLILVGLYALISPETFYAGQLSEYYLIPSWISYLVIFAELMVWIYKQNRLFAQTTILFLVIINLQTLLHIKHSNGFAAKSSQVRLALDLFANKPFKLEVVGNNCQIYGYRYLFTLWNKEPTTSYLDPQFAWLYQSRLPLQKPEIKLVLDADSKEVFMYPEIFR